MHDVIIVGGGPTGLNAALLLGRVRRRALLVDAGNPRNAVSNAVHGFMSRDGASPALINDAARKELSAYPSVEALHTVVESAQATEDGFETALADGGRYQARRLLLATGVADVLPDIEGLVALWGRGVFHCPYCHGWEVRDKPLAVLGGDTDAARLALYMTRLSPDVVLCANGPLRADAPLPDVLMRCGVRVREERVSRVQGKPGAFERVVFVDGETLSRAALFLRPPVRQRSNLPVQLGCTLMEDRRVQVDQNGLTTVPGVFAAGDLCRTPEMHLPTGKVIISAAAGALTAVAIDLDLMLSDVTSGRTPSGTMS